MDAAEVMSVDHHRHKLMDKIKTNVIRERIERIAQLDQLRRERQRNGEEIEPDESSPLLSADTTVDDNLSFGLFHVRRQKRRKHLFAQLTHSPFF